MDIKVGDIVARRSYKCDLLFRVKKVIENKDGKKIVELYGEDFRLIADAPLEDIVKIDENERHKRKQKAREHESHSYRLFTQDYHLQRQKQEYGATKGYSTELEYFHLPGKVLHLDGDPLYLKKCTTVYERLGIPYKGVHLNETDMHTQVGDLIERVRPDILVITGHDAYSKNKGTKMDIKAYRHSRHFVQTVKEARKKVPNLDQLVIFAGACQSHFESLIRAGANFASSPSRINIHALDPVYIVAKICFTSYMENIYVWDVIRNTLTGEKGVGGIETRGLLRMGMPFNDLEE